ncbi:MAG: histidinol dehydrogenase [Bryobacterales bacterium]|nr:histidinol dehydrogenase [Bryobacterales bacterium]
MIRILESAALGRLLARRDAKMSDAEAIVRPILEAVKKQGDKGLLKYAKQFDNFKGRTVQVQQADLESANSRLTDDFRAAVEIAAHNVREYAEAQLPVSTIRKFSKGRELGQIVRPLDTVSAYIPAGRYTIPSTVIMTAVPALAAGVPNICIACPKAVDEVDGTAHMLGVHQVFRVGGAQAIAAFAYGTKTVPKADRIVGPGNIYVAAAKKLLAGEVGIDFVAGPTEILIIANEGEPAYFAADMLAQAEHDTDASAILLTTDRALADAVAVEIERQLETLTTAAVARVAIAKNSAIIIVRDLEEAAELSNRFAPEHLSLHHEELLPLIRHAGSVFIGPFSPEAAGDYASGPNHVLPTSGVARLRGGLSAADYVKVISVQKLNRKALSKIASSVTTLARAEGLEAHARSVEIRLPAYPHEGRLEDTLLVRGKTVA